MNQQAQLVSLHLRNPQPRLPRCKNAMPRKQEAAFQVLPRFDNLPEIEQRQLNTKDTADAINQQARTLTLW